MMKTLSLILAALMVVAPAVAWADDSPEPELQIQQPTLPTIEERKLVLPEFVSPKDVTHKLIDEGTLVPGRRYLNGADVCYDTNALNVLVTQFELVPKLSYERTDAAWKQGWLHAAQSWGAELDRVYVWGIEQKTRADGEQERADTLAEMKQEGWETWQVVLVVVGTAAVTAGAMVGIAKVTPDL